MSLFFFILESPLGAWNGVPPQCGGYAPPAPGSSAAAASHTRWCHPEWMPCPFWWRRGPVTAGLRTARSASRGAGAPRARGWRSARPAAFPCRAAWGRRRFGGKCRRGSWRVDRGRWRECTWGATGWGRPPPGGRGGWRGCSTLWKLNAWSMWCSQRRWAMWATGWTGFGECWIRFQSSDCPLGSSLLIDEGLQNTRSHLNVEIMCKIKS